jgi:hypothetical protein
MCRITVSPAREMNRSDRYLHTHAPLLYIERGALIPSQNVIVTATEHN